MMIRLLALMAVLTLGACATTPPSGPPPPTILISIDGFRPTTWTVALRRCSPGWRRTGRLHNGRNARVAPIFCLPDPGWSITTRAFKPKKPDLGNHGFDPASPDMAAVFIRHGPAFRRGVRLPIFDNVDVYPLLARLAGVQAGRWAACADTASTRHLIRYLHYALNIAETHKETRCG